jgi:cyclic pyranopterin monophosphate synthase
MLTHVNKRGQAHMVDIGHKDETKRIARAHGVLVVSKATLTLVRRGQTNKSDVLATARIAGISAAKETSRLIPLCHPLALSHVSVEIALTTTGIEVVSTCECVGKTGVEMEALTATSVALLTLYDMLKSHDRTMSFTVQLTEKHGGRSGSWTRKPRVQPKKRSAAIAKPGKQA